MCWNKTTKKKTQTKKIVRRNGEKIADFIPRLDLGYVELQEVEPEYQISGTAWTRLVIERVRIPEDQDTMVLSTTDASYDPNSSFRT